jgi:ABC-2 type transport system ATP-binding protein
MGTVDDVRGLVERTRVSCKTVLAAETIQDWPGVESVAHSNGRLCVTARDGESLVRRLLAADETLHELEVQRASLADAPPEVSDHIVQETRQ